MKNIFCVNVSSLLRAYRFLFVLPLLLTLLLAVAVPPQTAHSAGALLIVNNLGDESRCGIGGCPPCDGTGVCTLRDAIQRSNDIETTYNNIRFSNTVSWENSLYQRRPLPPILKEGTWIDGSDQFGNPVNVILSGSTYGEPAEALLTIDSGDIGTTKNGKNITISNLWLCCVPDHGRMVEMLGGTQAQIAFNHFGTTPLLKGGCFSDFYRQKGYAVEISATVRGSADAGRGTAYIYGNSFVCLDTAIRAYKSNVYIGEARDGTQAGNSIGAEQAPNLVAIKLHASNNLVKNNTIQWNESEGIQLAFPTNPLGINRNLIQDNLIDHDGIGINLERGNGQGGVTDNVIWHNQITGNSKWGIRLVGRQVANNQIVGNKIGTDGTYALGNDGAGVLMSDGAHDNLIGGSYQQTIGNLISGNRHEGIKIAGEGTRNNRILGNTIGLNEIGNAPLPNAVGILFEAGVENIIGGDNTADWNVISGNESNGVVLQGSLTRRNRVMGNLIGTDRGGSLNLGNQSAGLVLNARATANIIGSLEGTGNIITHHNGAGISVLGGARDNQIFRNEIMQNNGPGILITDAHGQGLVFRTIIHDNRGPGIAMTTLPGADFAWSFVSIFNNGGLGIDLKNDAVTSNDRGDPDNGPNGLQNFPHLSGANSGGRDTSARTIGGDLDSLPRHNYRIEFYASAACDPLGNGEGQRYLGYLNDQHTNASGVVRFMATSSTLSLFRAGEYITAFATEQGSGDSSEFSQCVRAQ